MSEQKMSSRPVLRENVYLIGYETNQIIGNKLPTNKQVLCVLFHNLRIIKLSLKDSLTLVFQEVGVFWQKARIPIRKDCHCISKIKDLYNEWRNIHKNASRRSESQKKLEDGFKSKLNDLFDIASANALEIMKDEESKQFLILQRSPGRPGYIAGVDYIGIQSEELEREKIDRTIKLRKRAYDEIEKNCKLIFR